ncbi:MAG: hypothetical protein ACYTGB_02710 [Planctomycetota bacterium]|jgi:hypothetical protein
MRFPSGTARVVPYDDVLRVRVRKDGVLIADQSDVAITGTTTEVKVTTSATAP